MRCRTDDRPASPSSVRLSWPWRLFDAVARRLLLATAAATFLAFFARTYWLFDDLTSFIPQYALAATVAFVALLLLRRPGWAVAAGVLFAVNGFRIWSGSPPPAEAGASLSILSANVHTSNREFKRLLGVVEREAPDFVLLMEIDDGWAEALSPLRDAYPHAVVHPRSDNFGIAFFSRIPAEIEVVELGDAEVPSVVVRVFHDGDQLTVIGTHPLPPVGAAMADARNRQLAAVAKLARDADGEVLVAGDLNVSPWSPYFQDLLNDGDLSDTRTGLALQATWPRFFPPMMTPIDHVLISDGLVISDRRVTSDIGSDHRSVLARFTFRR